MRKYLSKYFKELILEDGIQIKIYKSYVPVVNLRFRSMKDMIKWLKKMGVFK
jgi:hypothetical protein